MSAYSVLVVSSVENFNSAMAAMLSKFSCHPIIYANSIATAKRAAAEREFDIIIINSPLKDDLGIRFAIDSSTQSLVLVLSPNEIHSDVYDKVGSYGIFTLPKPMSHQAMETALRWITTAKIKLKKAETKSGERFCEAFFLKSNITSPAHIRHRKLPFQIQPPECHGQPSP